MSKYIIEIEDEPFVRQSALFGEEGLYRAKGFKSLVFDQLGLDKLTPLDKALDEAYQNGYEVGQHEATTLEYQQGLEEGKKQAKAQAHLDVCHDIERVAHGNYQKGLDDAWKALLRITGLNNTVRNNIFGMAGIDNILVMYTAQEAIAKICEHEEQQKTDSEIKVGDIITDGKINYLVIDITDKSYVALQGTDFEPTYIGKDYIKSYHNLHDSKDMRKIAEEINKAMKGEQQERRCISCEHYNSPIEMRCIHCRNYDKWEPKGGED